MILQLISWGCLFTKVQSAVTSAESCFYLSGDLSCSGGFYGECQDICELPSEIIGCGDVTCDALKFNLQQMGGWPITNWDQCFSPGSGKHDATFSCEEDGDGVCDGDQDLCVTLCISTDGQCNECFDYAYNMAKSDAGGLDCHIHESNLLDNMYDISTEWFTGFCECVTVNESYDAMIGCPSSCVSGSGSSSSDNSTGMIIGVVVGAIVLVVAVIAVIISMKRRKLRKINDCLSTS